MKSIPILCSVAKAKADPDESIEVGVKYFADMWKGHQGYEVLNIVQVYDFGGGFLSHSGTGGNSEIAKIASDELADGIHEGAKNTGVGMVLTVV